jgi:hypothetical protein
VPLWLALRAGLPPLLTHAASLAIADMLLVAFALRRVRGWARTAQPARRPLPALALPAAVGPYALWGLVYFLLIFSDRLIAWTADGGVRFRPGYEAALQIALVPLLLVLPLLEHVLVRFGELLEQAAGEADPRAALAGRRRAVRAQAALVAAGTAAYGLLALAVWIVVERFPGIVPLGAARLASKSGEGTALICALVAYGCFVGALGIASAYQLLQRPWPMVLAGAAAVSVDVAVGLAASRHGGPELASLGLLSGAIVFLAGIVTRWARDRRRLDYLWFASG